MRKSENENVNFMKGTYMDNETKQIFLGVCVLVLGVICFYLMLTLLFSI